MLRREYELTLHISPDMTNAGFSILNDAIVRAEQTPDAGIFSLLVKERFFHGNIRHKVKHFICSKKEGMKFNSKTVFLQGLESGVEFRV